MAEEYEDGLVMRRYVLAWVPMVFIAIVNGTLREAWYRTYLDELGAHQLSTVTLVLLLGAYMWVVIRLWRPSSAAQALIIGVTWCALTVGFEFVFGYSIAGHPWSRLLADYNIVAGRLWNIILVWLTLAPSVFYRVQKH
jgi:hypothetical protein